MKEIKYRAYHKTLKILVDVLLIDWLNELVDLEGGLIEQEFEDVELLQYIGLKDVNDVEIYEGYIVSSFLGNTEVCIGKFNYEYMEEFDNEETVIPLYGLHLDSDGYKFNLNPNETYEIIGNRFENPELLEVTNE